MLAIRNIVRQMFAMTTLLTIKAALLRACGKQPQQSIQQREPVTGTPPIDELYVEVDDPEESFAAWDAARNERLHQVQQYEQQGLSLLSKAALLRAAILCDDRGETFLAEEIREQAEAIGSRSFTEVPSDTWERPLLPVLASLD
jgi:hypothetical protein